jgi:hypothetical protein
MAKPKNTRLAAALAIAALASIGCDFTPICPPNTAYDPAIRRCRIIDPSLGEVDAYVPPPADGGPVGTDAPMSEDASSGEGGTDDGGTDDGGGDVTADSGV